MLEKTFIHHLYLVFSYSFAINFKHCTVKYDKRLYTSESGMPNISYEIAFLKIGIFLTLKTFFLLVFIATLKTKHRFKSRPL